jgi:cytochrome P450
MSNYETVVDAAIDRLLDQVSGQDSFELVSAFASPLPIAVITQMLGLADEPERLRRVGATLASALDGVQSISHAVRLFVADRELRASFDELLARAAREPGDDLASVLVAQQGGQISSAELTSLIGLLLLAGFETTVNAIGNGVRALLNHREQWELLVADPSRAEAVAEEVLRYDPPVQQTARVLFSTADPVELAGTTVQPGQWLLLLLAAANRDPDVFADPDRFDITRANATDHLAFSGGIHYCLGAALARMELAAAFRALATRFPRLRANGRVVMRPGTTLRGPRRLPVAV